MKKTSRLFSVFVLMSLTLLCGCWDIKEIDKRDIPLIIGIHKENNDQYKVTLYIPVTEKRQQIIKNSNSQRCKRLKCSGTSENKFGRCLVLQTSTINYHPKQFER